jgi:two-component system, sensor histidine kinase YesM
LFILKKARNLSLAQQLILAITVMVFCLLSVVIGFTYNRTINIITDQQAASNLELLNLKKSNYENYFSQIEDYSMLLRYNARLVNIFSDSKPLDYTDTTYVCSALRDAFYSRNDIVSYKLYLLQHNTCYAVTKADFNVRTSYFDSLNDIKYHKETYSAKNYIYFKPNQSASGQTFTICRVFINIINHRELAYVELTVDDSFIQNLSGDSSGMSSVLCLLDQKNQLYYSGDRNVLNTGSLSPLAQSFPANKQSGDFSFLLNKTNYLSVFSNSQDGRWRFVSLIPQDRVQKTVVDTRNLSLLLALIAFLASVLIIFGLIRMQLKPLQLLAKHMQSVGKGDFKTKIDIGGNAEVKNLSCQFNSMTSHIDELIKKNYIAELNEKTAHLKALEAQINPHFLYNTLQAISTEAVLAGQHTIVQMVEALASLLRYSIQNKDLVQVETEIKHVQQYLFLQTARFEDRLSYRITVDDSAEKMLIPKISIQILVENSFIHGFADSGGHVHIDVEVQAGGGFLHASVTDNGTGMTPQRLAEVCLMMEPDNREGNEIGLSNLSSRLKILFDSRASLSISSRLGNGTKVEMSIPLTEGEITNV